MPFAQWTYPVTLSGPEGEELTLEGIEDLIRSPIFPANYITEAVDQTRGWFYSLLALSTLITGKPSYENCLVLGLILDGKGEKMSKSQGNMASLSMQRDWCLTIQYLCVYTALTTCRTAAGRRRRPQ